MRSSGGRATWQGKKEGGPLAGLGLRPDLAAVAADHAAHGGQPHTGSRKLGHGMQPLKSIEELVGLGHVKARAVVLHEKHR